VFCLCFVCVCFSFWLELGLLRQEKSFIQILEESSAE
jgi:hypothetical protein